MALYILQRLARAVVVIVLVTFAVVLLLSLTPGSVSEVILGENATPEAVAAMDERLGVDRPLLQQYVSWLGDAVHGDLGNSVMTQQPVADAIRERLPVTLELAVLALLLSLAISIPLALWAATRPGTRVDKAISGLSAVFLSVPAFVAAPLLIYVFGLKLGWFPVLGWHPISEGLGPNLKSALLPAIAIALPEVAGLQRILRTDLVTTLGDDYIAAARARGLRGRYVLMRHAFRPSSFSLITLSGISLGRLLGGTVIVEALFVLPGLGSLVAASISSRDVIIVQGVVAFVAVTYVLINTLVDISYGFIDPRIRKGAA